MLEQNLIDSLKYDHRDIEQLVFEIERVEPAQALGILSSLQEALEIHFNSEEGTVYTPCLSKNDQELDRVVRTSEEAHKKLRQLVWSLINGGNEEPTWRERVTELRSMMENYIYMEERELFPVLRQSFDEQELDRINSEYGECRANQAQGRAA